MIDDTVAMFKRALEVVLEKPHQTLGSSQLGIVDGIMNIAVDSERPDERMVQVLIECPCDEIAQANVWCLQGFDEKMSGRNL